MFSRQRRGNKKHSKKRKLHRNKDQGVHIKEQSVQGLQIQPSGRAQDRKLLKVRIIS
jgi:hypothetical protein